MKLQAGQMAPDLEAMDLSGHPVSLRALRGRAVLLSFYRYASCPLCNLRVRDLREAAPQLQALGLVAVGVFQSDAATLGRHVGRQRPPFSLLADPGMALYRRYGVERSGLAMLHPATLAGALRAMAAGFLPGRIDGPVDRMPADFLIDAQGRIAVAHYGRHAGDHLPIEVLKEGLAAAAALA